MLLIMWFFFFFPFYPFIQDASEIRTLMEKEEVSTIVLTIACEQALHLGDIVKSTRARGTREETRLRGGGEEKGRSLRSPK